MPEKRDRELLNRFLAEQDAASLECLIRRHGDLVFAVCSRVLRNRHDAEDAFQATFLILVARPPRLRRSASLSGWLFRVAHRTALRVARDRRRLVELDDFMLPAPEPFEDVYKQESVLALDEELSALPERYRAPLVLCSLMGKSRREAATQLGRSEASVKASLVRGKHLLRTRLLRRGILLSVAAAAGKQLSSSSVGASEQIVELTGHLCAGNPQLPGAHATPSSEIQSLANAGVREMTSAFSTKLTASAVAATVVAGGVLVASIDSPRPAGAVPPLGSTTLLDSGGGDAVAFEQSGADETSSGLNRGPAPGTGFEPPLPPPGGLVPLNVTVPARMATGNFPAQQSIYQVVEQEPSREETQIDIDYQRAMADVMQLKAEAKLMEAQAMRASDEEQETLLHRSREHFAIAESREFEAEAVRLSAQADLLEQRLTALGEPVQTPGSTSPSVPNRPTTDTIEAGDVLRIRLIPDPDGIWGVRELTVSPEGNITLPYVGEQPVAGLEFREFGEKLEKYYTAGNVFENPVFEIMHTRPRSEQQLLPGDAIDTFQPEPIAPLQPGVPSNPEPINERVPIPPAVDPTLPEPSGDDLPPPLSPIEELDVDSF